MVLQYILFCIIHPWILLIAPGLDRVFINYLPGHLVTLLYIQLSNNPLTNTPPSLRSPSLLSVILINLISHGLTPYRTFPSSLPPIFLTFIQSFYSVFLLLSLSLNQKSQPLSLHKNLHCSIYPFTSLQNPIMRRGTLIFLIINLIVIGFLLNAFSTLISLLFIDGHADAIHRSEIPAPGSELIENRTQLIPKIIHQTYINSSIPERWKKGHQSCVDLHDDYEYKLWTDEASRAFIAAEYPWFLDTFDSYPFPIQRADSIRYFVLAHYGGSTLTSTTAVTDVLIPSSAIPPGCAVRSHGNQQRCHGFRPPTSLLPPRHRIPSILQQKLGMPYITVMYSTGPLFLSVLWIEYMRTVTDEAGRVRNLMPDEYSKHSWVSSMSSRETAGMEKMRRQFSGWANIGCSSRWPDSPLQE
ncbi:hypothetical protein EYC84_003238 [Monilinia fructicola]|uniref:Mannosyltransferase n=1 Tax=Monilinia fructicola TaxID=38448 RepID=A0A5M9JWY5_MONFR|nr:hypothetical protein EYC84_003238 [Monilinia fructicola]